MSFRVAVKHVYGEKFYNDLLREWIIHAGKFVAENDSTNYMSISELMQQRYPDKYVVVAAYCRVTT